MSFFLGFCVSFFIIPVCQGTTVTRRMNKWQTVSRWSLRCQMCDVCPWRTTMTSWSWLVMASGEWNGQQGWVDDPGLWWRLVSELVNRDELMILACDGIWWVNWSTGMSWWSWLVMASGEWTGQQGWVDDPGLWWHLVSELVNRDELMILACDGIWWVNWSAGMSWWSWLVMASGEWTGQQGWVDDCGLKWHLVN